MNVHITCILAVTLLLALSSNATETNSGPVTTIMQNIAFNTASITDEIQLQLSTKIKHTSNSIRGNIEIIVANTMEQLSDTIFQANETLNTRTCKISWTMPALLENIDTQLSSCTNELSNILNEFQVNADIITTSLKSYFNEIVALPTLCQLTDSTDSNEQTLATTFASSSSCFVTKIADINNRISQELNRISMSIVQTRQSSTLSLDKAKQCSNDFVSQVEKHLSSELQNCI